MASTVYKYTFIVMSLGVGAAGALKLLSDVDTAQGSSFYAYRRKLLTGDPDDDTRDLTNDKYMKQSWYKTVLDEAYLDWSKIGISALGGLCVGAALFKFHYMKNFVKCQPNRALIIYNRYEGHREDNGVLNNAYAGEGNGCYVYPYFEKYGFVEECDIPLKLQDYKVMINGEQELDITLDLIVGVGDTYPEVEYAASRLLNLSEKQIEEKAMELLKYGLAENLKHVNLEDIEAHKKEFNIYLQQQIGWYLKYVGLYIRKAPLMAYKSQDDTVQVVLKDMR